MRSRRALLGLLAGGGVAAANWRAAQACSYSLQDCRGFRRQLRRGETLVRAVVEARTDTLTPTGNNDEYYAVYDITARTTEVLVGLAGEHRVYTTRARLFDCGTIVLGYLPEIGDEVILTIGRDEQTRERTVLYMDSAKRFDQMASRCT
ncbi:MAG TPA: hypothetical protein PLF78_08075 [Caulobacter sp.]|nr:hypothetical protein [Caulobacter sp.]